MNIQPRRRPAARRAGRPHPRSLVRPVLRLHYFLAPATYLPLCRHNLSYTSIACSQHSGNAHFPSSSSFTGSNESSFILCASCSSTRFCCATRHCSSHTQARCRARCTIGTLCYVVHQGTAQVRPSPYPGRWGRGRGGNLNIRGWDRVARSSPRSPPANDYARV